MLLQLKSTPTLKILKCHFNDKNTEKIKSLRLQLPHISINEGHLNIAGPKLWETEISAKQQNIFFQSTVIMGPPASPDGPAEVEPTYI